MSRYQYVSVGQGKKEKESLINKNINFQLVSSHARPQGSIFEDGRFYLYESRYLKERNKNNFIQAVF